MLLCTGTMNILKWNTDHAECSEVTWDKCDNDNKSTKVSLIKYKIKQPNFSKPAASRTENVNDCL